MNEKWANLLGFDGYSISTEGRVLRVCGGQGRRIGRCLSPHKAGNGYFNVRILKNGRTHTISIHASVCLAFIGPRPAGQQIRHGDGDKSNNRLSNLQYGTPLENAADKQMHGTTARGEKTRNTTLSQEQAELCIRLLADGMSPTEISRVHAIPRNPIYKIKRGESWAWLSANNRATDRAMQ